MLTTETPVRPHISHSQLNLFANCAEAYRRRYVEGEIIPPGIAALRGRAVHGAAEINHRQKLTTGIDLPLADLLDAAATSFDATQASEGYVLLPEEQALGAEIALGKGKDAAVKLTGLYQREVAPTIMPALVEERIRIHLPDAPADMLGVLDVATVDDRIVDLKTKAKSETQSAADSSLQLTWYSATFRAKTGREEAGLDLEVLVDTKVAKHQRLSTIRDRRDFQVLINRINAMQAATRAGLFMPASIGAWQCSFKWCGYWSTCRYVNAERKAAAEAAE